MWSTIWRNPSFTQRPRDTRLRALFIENLSGPVLQMLGTKYPYSILLSSSTYQRITFRYNIEPFFWSSSLNWIPSRFQEEIKENVGDRESDLKYSLFFFFWHACSDITITLTFLHSMSNHDAIQLAANRSSESVHDASTFLGSQNIDTHAPLILYSSLSFILFLSLLF